MFVQYLVERTHDVVKSERKPRRNIQYRDVANAVARIDNLEFLTDVVPRTQSYKSFKEGQAKRAKENASSRDPTQADQPMPDSQAPVPGPANTTIASSGAMDRRKARPEPHFHPVSEDMRQRLDRIGQVFVGKDLSALPDSPPVAVNGHAHQSHQSHSRNHSLEHQNILHPNPPAPDAMQIDARPPPPPVYVGPQGPPVMRMEPSRDPAAQQLRMEALAGTPAVVPSPAMMSTPPIMPSPAVAPNGAPAAPVVQAPPTNEYRGFVPVNGGPPR